MKVDFDPVSGHVIARFSTTTRVLTGSVVYATAQWVYAHDDGYGYTVTGDQGTFRMRVEKVEPEGVPYA
jgi:hypothetical protein